MKSQSRYNASDAPKLMERMTYLAAFGAFKTTGVYMTGCDDIISRGFIHLAANWLKAAVVQPNDNKHRINTRIYKNYSSEGL